MIGMTGFPPAYARTVLPVPPSVISIPPSGFPAGSMPTSPVSPNSLPFMTGFAALGTSFSPTATGPVRTLSAPLINGATGHLARMPNQGRSMLAISIPLDAMPTGTEDLLPLLLENGSQGTRQMLSACRDQGIHLWLERQDDRLVLKAGGAAGQEPAMAQIALRMLVRPLIDEPSFRASQEAVLRNLQGRRASPDAKLQTVMNKAMYGPFHTFSLSDGEKARIISRHSLPEVITAYGRMLQSIPSSHLLLLSPQPPEIQQCILNDAIRRTGWFPTPGVAPALSPALSLPNPRGPRMPVLINNPTLQKALIKVAWKAPDALNPDYPAYLLLREILDGRSTGSFFQTLRTGHGLVYSISSSEGERLASGMPYQAEFEVGFDKVGPALADLDGVLRNLLQNPVPPAAMATLKRKALLHMRDMLQTPETTARFYEPWLKRGSAPPDATALRMAIDQIQPEDIRRVAQSMFDPAYGFRLTGVSAPAWVLNRWFPGYPTYS